MSSLTSVLKHLEQERSRLASQLKNLDNAISALNGTTNNRNGRRISAAGRARIAAAQRAGAVHICIGIGHVPTARAHPFIARVLDGFLEAIGRHAIWASQS